MLRVGWILVTISLTLSLALVPASSLAQPAPDTPDPERSPAGPPDAAAGPAAATPETAPSPGPTPPPPTQPPPAAAPTAAGPPVVSEPAPSLVRTSGYSSLNMGFPMGSITSSAPLSDMAGRAFRLEGGPELMIARHVVMGFNVAAGLVAVGDNLDATCRSHNVSCHGAILNAGAHLEFLLAPAGSPVVPWIGVEAGYELLALSVSDGTSSADASFAGNQFEIRAGLDFHVREQGGWGPFVAYQSGKYTSVEITGSSSMEIPNQSGHGWLLVGLRGRL